MRIDIWSDVACPWCYIGKSRLEEALAGFEHADEVEVVYHAYQLDPSAPTTGDERSAESLARKIPGGPAQVKQMLDRVEATAAEAGIIMRLSETLHVNTIDAHRLLRLALDTGHQAALKGALLAAHFTDVENTADHDVLIRVAVSVGMDEARVREVLGSTEFMGDVRADIAQAQAMGSTGVPFFVFDGKYGVPGAQPVEAFSDVLTKVWSESRPTEDIVEGGGEACGPDACAV